MPVTRSGRLEATALSSVHVASSLASTDRSLSRDRGLDLPIELGAIYREHARYVAAIGLRMLGREHEVDDLVQDVFLEAMRGLSRVREPAAIRGWLATIAVRRANKRLRRRYFRMMFHLDESPDYEACAAPDATPEERAHVASIYRALDRLAPRARVIWALRHIEGETLERTAELTSCSLSTVQRTLRETEQAIDLALEGER
jgi:RNA polymerase sigma-70 factor (ECF subfamily)